MISGGSVMAISLTKKTVNRPIGSVSFFSPGVSSFKTLLGLFCCLWLSCVLVKEDVSR